MTDPQDFDLQTLIENAVSHFAEGNDEAESLGWSAICSLQRRPTRDTLDAGITLCRSSDPLRRRVGASLLGQLGHTKIGFTPVFTEERFAALHALLVEETHRVGDTDVISDVCSALGHLKDPRAIGNIVILRGHSSRKVRSAVVHGLSGYDDQTAIASLIELSGDIDDDVRDWATFGLGQLIDTDTAEIRDALDARLGDENPDVQVEAIAGLARRKDRSVLPVLVRELERQFAAPLFDAAADLADPMLCHALAAAKKREQPWPPHIESAWGDAMRACGCPLV
jgi:HEAT repeat protein